MCHLYAEGRTQEALQMQLKYLSLINALFCEVNPIPVKAAMAAMGFCENSLRLPLIPMSDKNEAILRNCMQNVGLLEG